MEKSRKGKIFATLRQQSGSSAFFTIDHLGNIECANIDYKSSCFIESGSGKKFLTKKLNHKFCRIDQLEKKSFTYSA